MDNSSEIGCFGDRRRPAPAPLRDLNDELRARCRWRALESLGIDVEQLQRDVDARRDDERREAA